MKLETKLNTLLPDGNGPFNVYAFELCREAEGGWSVNDGWQMADYTSFAEVRTVA